MTFVGWIEIAVTLALVIGFAIPMGAFMTAIFTGEKTVLTPCLRAVGAGLLPTIGGQAGQGAGLAELHSIHGDFYGRQRKFLSSLFHSKAAKAFAPFQSKRADELLADLRLQHGDQLLTNANWQAYAG